MTVVAVANLTIFGRPVNPRASRMADIVASVPELTRRTFQLPRRATRSLRQAEPRGTRAPNERPCAAVSFTDSMTAGCACPRIAGPHEPTGSTYSLPSASTTYGLARHHEPGESRPRRRYAYRRSSLPGVTAWPQANHSVLCGLSSFIRPPPVPPQWVDPLPSLHLVGCPSAALSLV